MLLVRVLFLANLGAVLSVYTPGETQNPKPPQSSGIKTVGWKPTTARSLTIHQSYSNVKLQQHSNDDNLKSVYDNNRQGKAYNYDQQVDQHFDQQVDQKYEQVNQGLEDFDQVAQKFEQVDQQFDQQSQKFDFDQHSQNFDQHSQHFDQQSQNFDQHSQNFDQHNQHHVHQQHQNVGQLDQLSQNVDEHHFDQQGQNFDQHHQQNFAQAQNVDHHIAQSQDFGHQEPCGHYHGHLDQQNQHHVEQQNFAKGQNFDQKVGQTKDVGHQEPCGHDHGHLDQQSQHHVEQQNFANGHQEPCGHNHYHSDDWHQFQGQRPQKLQVQYYGNQGSASQKQYQQIRPQNYYSGRQQISTGPAQAYSSCPQGQTGQFVYELSCNQFLNCYKGRGHRQNCSPGTLFNPRTLECDFAEKVECITGPKRVRNVEVSQNIQAACPKGFSGIIPDYHDCSKFLNCANGVQNVMDCPPGTLFDIKSNTCDFANKASCVNGEKAKIPRPNAFRLDDYQNHNLSQNPQGHRVNLEEATWNQRQGSHGFGQNSTRSQQLVQSEKLIQSSPSNQLTQLKCPQGYTGLHPHPDCSKFLNCNGGGHVVQNCAPGTLFNPDSKMCDFPHKVKCASTKLGVSQSYKSQEGKQYIPARPPNSSWNQQQTYQNQNWNQQNRHNHSWNAQGYHQGHHSQAYHQGHHSQNYHQGDHSQNYHQGQRQFNHSEAYHRGQNWYLSQHDHQGHQPCNHSKDYHQRYDNQNGYHSPDYHQGYHHNNYPFNHSKAYHQGQNQFNRSLVHHDNYDAWKYHGNFNHSRAYHQNHHHNHDFQHDPDCPHHKFASKLTPNNTEAQWVQNLGTTPKNWIHPTPRTHHNPEPGLDQGQHNFDQNHDGQSKVPSWVPPKPTWRPNWITVAYTTTKTPVDLTPVSPSGNLEPVTSLNPNWDYNWSRPGSSVRPIYQPDDSRPGNWPVTPLNPNWDYNWSTPRSSVRPIYHPDDSRPGNWPPGLPVTNPTSVRPIYQPDDSRPGNWPPAPTSVRPIYQPDNSRPGNWPPVINPTPARPIYRPGNSQPGNWPQPPETPLNPIGPIPNWTSNFLTPKPTDLDTNASNNVPPKQWPPNYNPNQLTTPRSPSNVPNQPNSIPKHWPPPFPSTDLNADYTFDYENEVELEADIDRKDPKVDSKKVDDWCDAKAKGFECGNKICIAPYKVCDGVPNCPNGRDEKGCSSALEAFNKTANTKLAVRETEKQFNITLRWCALFCDQQRCKAFNYRKYDGTCFILSSNVGLSGALIILPNYDYYENIKYSVDCKQGYLCKNKKCLNRAQICDGANDCGDAMDEKGCSAEAFGYKISLVGSGEKNSGRIEVQAFGKTGYICDDMFGLRNADVACRELGFALGALEVKGNSYFGKGLGNDTFYMMDDVTCLGNETTLRDCDFSGWGVHNCQNQEVVGVICKTPVDVCPQGHWQCAGGNECLPLPFVCDGVYDCTDKSDESKDLCHSSIEIRLANGSSPSNGRVEVRYHGIWGTVCDDDFNDDAAKVVCAQLGYLGSSCKVKKDGYFGAGSGPIWLDQVFCKGNETSLSTCVHWDWGEHNCEHSEDVGVICGNQLPGSPRNINIDQEEVEEDVRPDNTELLPKTCGIRSDAILTENSDVHFRVVRGSLAKQGEYPWQASIRIQGKSRPTHWCGAIVIAEKFVLTAAHCLVGFSKGAYFVVAGDYNIDTPEGTEQEAYIEDFILHHEFREGNKMNNDIAIIKLKGRGFKITKDVQPICLPESDADYEQGMNCTISGFGSIESGKSKAAHDLRAGWIPIQSREVCKMPHIYGDSITSGMLCAGSLNEGVDACDGDSGGPLACLHEGFFTLIGITSWGQHCGYANKPGVYVKVAHYRSWIEETMRKMA